LREDAKVEKEYFMGVRAAKLVVLQLRRLDRKLRKKREFSWFAPNKPTRVFETGV